MTAFRLSLGIAVLIALFAYTPPVSAAPVTELEVGGTATNNTIATAQAIPPSAFTLPVPSNVFNPPGFPTASVRGVGGDLCPPAGGPCTVDKDFYSFFASGGQVILDIDNAGLLSPIDTVLFLYDALGNQLAQNIDSNGGDPGTVTSHDSFIGSYFQTSPSFSGPVPSDSYFVPPAVPGEPGFLVRPFVLPGPGQYFVQARIEGAGDISGPQPGGQFGGGGYLLQISVQNVPEPNSLYLLGFGLVAIAACRAMVRKLPDTK